LEELLTSISKTEVQPVISLQFTVSDRLTLQKQLLINATNDARLQAEILAEASNLLLGDLVQIENSTTEQRPFLSPMVFQSTVSRQAVMPTIQPAMIEETLCVTFCWKLKNK
jgi:uncharacterized protein YggE